MKSNHTIQFEGAHLSRVSILVKKTFSLTLVFNALLTIACALSILGGFYLFFYNWHPFSPYLIDGSLFWVVIAAAVLNIFPSALLGRTLKTGRFLFHHYFYGFLVLLAAAVYVAVLTPASLLTIFLVDNTSVAVNVGRFFILGGFTLVLDDLPDVHKTIESALNRLKVKAKNGGKILSVLQLLTGGVSFYVFVAVCLSMAQNPQWLTLANFILTGTLLITSVTSFLFVKKRVWINLKVNLKDKNA